jgi:hypothetical protein
MARTTIARTALPATGLNLTDATYATLGVGANNGVEVPYRAGDLVVLRNDTGGASTFTIKAAQPRVYADVALTVPDMSVAVAAAKSHVIELGSIFKQADGDIYIDCSVAGKVLVLALGD